MELDPSIILSGQSPDIVGQLMRGTAAAGAQNQVMDANRLRGVYQTQGAGIANGDPGALNALAGIDPMAAQQVQQNMLGMDATRLGMQSQQQDMAMQRERMQMARDEAKQRASEYAAGISAQEAAAQAAQMKSALSAAAMAQTPEQWDQIATQFGAKEYVGQFDNRYSIIAGLIGFKDAMDLRAANTPVVPDPIKGAPSGYMFTQPGNPSAGVAPLPGYTPTSQVTVNNMGENSSAFDKKASEAAATRYDTIVADGMNAQRSMGDIEALAGLAANIGTGKTTEVLAALGPYAEAVGVPIEGLSDMQAFNAIRDRLVPSMRVPGAGASSDFDAKMFLSSLPSLARTPGGNKIISDTLTAVQKHKIAAAEIANRVFAGEMTWQEGDKQIAALGNPFETFNASRDTITGAGPVQINGFTIEEVK